MNVRPPAPKAGALPLRNTRIWNYLPDPACAPKPPALPTALIPDMKLFQLWSNMWSTPVFDQLPALSFSSPIHDSRPPTIKSNSSPVLPLVSEMWTIWWLWLCSLGLIFTRLSRIGSLPTHSTEAPFGCTTIILEDTRQCKQFFRFLRKISTGADGSSGSGSGMERG